MNRLRIAKLYLALIGVGLAGASQPVTALNLQKHLVSPPTSSRIRAAGAAIAQGLANHKVIAAAVAATTLAAAGVAAVLWIKNRPTDLYAPVKDRPEPSERVTAIDKNDTAQPATIPGVTTATGTSLVSVTDSRSFIATPDLAVLIATPCGTGTKNERAWPAILQKLDRDENQHTVLYTRGNGNYEFAVIDHTERKIFLSAEIRQSFPTGRPVRVYALVKKELQHIGTIEKIAKPNGPAQTVFTPVSDISTESDNGAPVPMGPGFPSYVGGVDTYSHGTDYGNSLGSGMMGTMDIDRAPASDMTAYPFSGPKATDAQSDSFEYAPEMVSETTKNVLPTRSAATQEISTTIRTDRDLVIPASSAIATNGTDVPQQSDTELELMENGWAKVYNLDQKELATVDPKQNEGHAQMNERGTASLIANAGHIVVYNRKKDFVGTINNNGKTTTFGKHWNLKLVPAQSETSSDTNLLALSLDQPASAVAPQQTTPPTPAGDGTAPNPFGMQDDTFHTWLRKRAPSVGTGSEQPAGNAATAHTIPTRASTRFAEATSAVTTAAVATVTTTQASSAVPSAMARTA